MQNTLYIEIIGCVSEEGFSLDELVIRVKQLFEQEGMAGVIGVLLALFDEYLCLKKLVRGEKGWKPQACCSSPRYELHDRKARRFRTSAGKVKIAWRRLKCQKCGRKVIPLREFLGLEARQSKTAELEKVVMEVISEQSYRRTSRHLDIVGEIPVPKSTAHRWVTRSGCDELPVDGNMVNAIFADGTGFKRRPNPEEGKDNRGDLKVVLGVTADGMVVPFGAWSGDSWEKIGENISKNAVGWDSSDKILISDGEPGLAEGLARLANEQQRCHWHAAHDLDFAMWGDKAGKEERREKQSLLAGILSIELPEEDFERVSEEDKAGILRSGIEAEKKVEDLVAELLNKGYTKAAYYVRKAKDKLFSYLRFWLRYGLVCPRVSSMIERMMREIGRRLKRMAFGWSDAGAAKMARIIIKRITNSGEWEKYWQERLRLSGNVMMVFRGVSVK